MQFYSAIGAIVAALIGGFLSLLTLTTSKDQKVSELRNEWINGFRDELSEVIAQIRWSEFWAEQFNKEPANAEKNPWVEDAYKTAYLSIVKALSSLRLRVNPQITDPTLRPLHQAFLTKLDELSANWYELNADTAATHTKELRDRAAPILQEEWRQIELGEPAHRTLKRVAVAVLVVGLLGVAGIGVKLAMMTPAPAATTSAPASPDSSRHTPATKAKSH